MKKGIVKVQISLFHSKGGQTALIYDEHEKFMIEEDATPKLLKKMKGEEKMYFYANTDRNTGEYELLEEAPEQDW